MKYKNVSAILQSLKDEANTDDDDNLATILQDALDRVNDVDKTVKSGDRLVDSLDGETFIVSIFDNLLTIVSLKTGSKFIDNFNINTNSPKMEDIRKALADKNYCSFAKRIKFVE